MVRGQIGEMSSRMDATYGIWRYDRMEKTTVYLSDDLQRRLRALARKTGRPQAQLIRDALERYVGAEEGDWPVPSWVGSASVGGDAARDKRVYRERWQRDLRQRRGDPRPR